MTRTRILAFAAVVVALAAVLALRFFGKTASEDADATPTPTITVAPIRAAAINDVVTAYGVVQADPAAALTIAAPRAVIVSRVLVRLGETVAAGQPLIEIANAPASEVAYRQAADAASFARADLSRVQRLFDEHLAASDQLSAAKKTLADAEAALAAQARQGGGQAKQTLTAPAASVVTSLTAATGDHVAQDAAMLVLARDGAASAKLGLEPSGFQFAAGQRVVLRPVAGGAPIASRLAMVGRAADPNTKLLDAVAPLGGAMLPIGSAVQGDITTGSHDGLVAPRSAVVFDETGPHLFTVSGGKAHRIFVKVGLDQGEGVEVSGPVAAGAQVAVEGAYELQDGMAVKVRGQ